MKLMGVKKYMIDSTVWEQLAEQYKVTINTVEKLASLLEKTGGLSARFEIEELGGKGLWQQGVGGSIGNGFDEAANTKVTGLCKDISDVIRTDKEQSTDTINAAGSGGLDDTIGLMPISLLPNAWWPDELGISPDVLGNAGTLRYAYFQAHNRLVIRQNLRNRIYDTSGYKVIKLVPGDTPGISHLNVRTETGVIPIESLKAIE